MHDDAVSRIAHEGLSLSTIWIGLGIAAAIILAEIALVWWVLTPPGPFEFYSPVLIVDDEAEWQRHVVRDRCVVFLDCDWNMNPAVFRPTFQEFARWCRAKNIGSVVVMNNSHDSALFGMCQQALAEYGMDPDEFQRGYFVGRILWMENGKVVAYEETMDFLIDEERDSVEDLIARTAAVYLFFDTR